MTFGDSLAWPLGIDPVHPVVPDGQRRLGTHEVRVAVRHDDWPRGDFTIVGAPILGLPVEGAAATFRHGLTEHGLISRTPDGRVAVALDETDPAWGEPALLQLVALAAHDGAPAIRVGLLGYGAIGAEHAHAIRDTAGLDLVAVCDTSAARIDAALETAPGARPYLDPELLLADPEVDAVIVSTPPDSHARWALSALDAGKHVVVEKPMALTTKECDAILARSDASGLAALVYQNRRFDPDFRALKKASADGLLGEIFHLEAFVGGYSHPCNFWHSDEAVSGGALFDWGSHIIDQVLDLIPGEVEYVTALEHKRHWIDVTNADHSRMTLVFAGGQEATFVHSDLAAALKPRWYVLGTRGAVVGDWRRASVIERSPVGTLVEDVLAPADSPPTVTLHSADGSVTVLSPPVGEPHPFHADLSLWLRYGFPPRVRGEQSRRVVSMLAAARESALLGGAAVKPS